jgi:hypothetical protein
VDKDHHCHRYRHYRQVVDRAVDRQVALVAAVADKDYYRHYRQVADQAVNRQASVIAAAVEKNHHHQLANRAVDRQVVVAVAVAAAAADKDHHHQVVETEDYNRAELCNLLNDTLNVFVYYSKSGSPRSD